MQRFFMAKKYDIDIDSYIGDWFSNKRVIKNKIASAGEEINVRVSSLGGDVDTALDVAVQFEAHGNVICDLIAFNASAATVLTLGAKKVRMHENSMYLIHKALVWIDEFGYMNEDDIEEVISKLLAAKENSAVVTLNIANMYAKKSGKGIKEILNLMKEEKWLSATAAKEWGFVDEIFSEVVTLSKSTNIVEMLNCANLPIPENMTETQPDDATLTRKDFITEIIAGIKNIFNTKPNEMATTTKFQSALLAGILNVTEFEAVEDKVSLSQEQITSIENSLKELNDAATTFENSISDKDATIADLNKQIENLKNAPGDKTTDVNHESDEITNTGDAPFDNSIIESAKALFNAIP